MDRDNPTYGQNFFDRLLNVLTKNKTLVIFNPKHFPPPNITLL